MRAEGQAHIDRIEAALALVRQSLDWDRALRRLEELDARVQDPGLWNDPKQAQAITQEQKRLKQFILDQVETVRDESDRKSKLRLVIEPRTSKINPDEMMTALMVHTSLETRYAINLTWIGRDGLPDDEVSAVQGEHSFRAIKRTGAHDERFGKVRTYHQDILKEVFILPRVGWKLMD